MESESSEIMLDILDVLQSHSSRDKALKQKDIIDILEKKYKYENLKDTRRTTFKRNLKKVFDHFELRHPGRIVLANEEGADDISDTFTNLKYHHDYTEEQLRLIADSLLFSKHIPAAEKKEMIDKLKNLTIVEFKSHLSRVESLSHNVSGNDQLFETIKNLDKAMERGKKVTFYYEDYVVNDRGKLVLQRRVGSDGQPRKYVINPYELAATNGRYYLICNNDKHDNLANYRVDRMIDIEILDDDVKLLKARNKSQALDIAKYMREHIYMFSGDVISVRMTFKQYVLGEFIDWFGTGEVVFSRPSEDMVQVSVRVNREAMKKWAIQYVKHVTVIYPDDLIADIKQELQEGLANYDNR